MRAPIRVAVLGTVVLALFAASAAPVFGDDTGNVLASVTVATPCLLIEGAAAIDFGTLAFSTPGPMEGVTASKPVGTSSLLNCSTTSENLFARGSDAVVGGMVVWALQPNLSNPCTAGTDKFSALTGDGTFTTFLSTSNIPFGSLAGGDAKQLGFTMYMPCTGSAGAGSTATFSYIYTATF